MWPPEMQTAKREKTKRAGQMIKSLMTRWGQARLENIWPLGIMNRLVRERSICYDLETDVFLSSPPTQSIKKISIFLFRAYLSFDPVK